MTLCTFAAKRETALLRRLFKSFSKENNANTSAPATKKTHSPTEKPKDSASKATNVTPKPSNNKSRPKKRRKPRTKKPVLVPWDSSLLDVPAEEGKTRFYDLNLDETLLHGIYDLGFKYCSPIQAQILPETLQGKDAIGKAQTGTGKTAAFLITLIDDFLKNPIKEQRYLAEPRALIIAPTRELVAQIAEDAKDLCKHTGLHIVMLIGGTDYEKQLKKLDQGYVDIVVATPGRLLDFANRKHIYLDQVESLVLDEADRMLDMGFIPQVRRIVRATPNTDYRQTLLFSATFTAEVLELSYQWTYEPVKVEIEPENIASDSVEQKVYMVSNEEKLPVLLKILQHPETKRVIIFTNRRDQAQRLFDRVVKNNISAGLLTGEIPQKKRTSTLAKFKNGEFKAMIATDVAGRGIHVEDISHVINYNLPDNPGDYIHRIGRTGRAGATGISISLACEFESFQVPAIEELLGEKLRCELPPEEFTP
ncbi:MAG: ATP-dependent RNA helicase RhlB [Gammaproteobacteria bacterium]|nr:ATP-dependent RNA helicase RhlB [Gammaproteobacteria bacterium]